MSPPDSLSGVERDATGFNFVSGLGFLPALNAFNKELLMVVTPRLLRQIAGNAELPVLSDDERKHYEPSFNEFFLSCDACPKPSSTGMSR